jgi:endo-1,4-beta-mannosidase
VRFGLNYTPSKHWWFIWQNWEPAVISRDLAQIASLGMDHIRIQLMWSVFQPTATDVDPVMLNRLTQLLDLADQNHLDVDVSVLTGYLSGQQFIPDWARAGNWVKRPDLVAGEVVFFQALGKAIGQHPRLMGFDTGNELIGHAPSQDPYALGQWSSTLIDAVRPLSPHSVLSVSPRGDFVPPHPDIVSAIGDVSVVHPWYFLSDAIVNGKLRDEPLHHIEYNIEYIKSFHSFAPQQPRRKVWVQEFGAPQVSFTGATSVPDAYAPDFATASYENALACEDLFALTWWDSHDIDVDEVPAHFHAPEPTLGVFTLAGKEKPVGSALASVIQRWKRGEIPIPAPRTVAVAGDNRLSYQQLLEQGIRPAIVPPGLAGDASYLARRGITRIAGAVSPDPTTQGAPPVPSA